MVKTETVHYEQFVLLSQWFQNVYASVNVLKYVKHDLYLICNMVLFFQSSRRYNELYENQVSRECQQNGCG